MIQTELKLIIQAPGHWFQTGFQQIDCAKVCLENRVKNESEKWIDDVDSRK